jgi:sodium-coupled neutral amino acid transporter 1
MLAMLEITHVSLLQAALFLGLGVLFSLISIPLVIYDWACSSGTDEGH